MQIFLLSDKMEEMHRKGFSSLLHNSPDLVAKACNLAVGGSSATQNDLSEELLGLSKSAKKIFGLISNLKSNFWTPSLLDSSKHLVDIRL